MTQEERPIPKDELLRLVDEGWRGFRGQVRHIGMARLRDKTPTGWTYKDLLAHAAAWEEEATRRLRAVRAGQDVPQLPDIDTDAFNARVVEERRLVGPEAILDELDAAHRTLVDVVRTLSEETILRPLVQRWIGANTFGHYAEHKDELDAAIPRVEVPSLQERYAAASTCYGCGPANPLGLRVRSFERDGEVVAEWTPRLEHEAYAGALNGGVVGTLFDCHANWTAASHLMRRTGKDRPPATVTAEYAVKFLRPASTAGAVRLAAHVVESTDFRAIVEAHLEDESGRTCATFRGTFVAVKPDHPAYHRWEPA